VYSLSSQSTGTITRLPGSGFSICSQHHKNWFPLTNMLWRQGSPLWAMYLEDFVHAVGGAGCTDMNLWTGVQVWSLGTMGCLLTKDAALMS
jgi:hypothetical protein